jgi:hypothetical protein
VELGGRHQLRRCDLLSPQISEDIGAAMVGLTMCVLSISVCPLRIVILIVRFGPVPTTSRAARWLAVAGKGTSAPYIAMFLLDSAGYPRECSAQTYRWNQTYNVVFLAYTIHSAEYTIYLRCWTAIALSTGGRQW